jgi:hypothetical protein
MIGSKQGVGTREGMKQLLIQVDIQTIELHSSVEYMMSNPSATSHTTLPPIPVNNLAPSCSWLPHSGIAPS